MAEPEEKGLSPHQRIVKEAKRRFNRCETWESTARKRWLEDVKFANGDSDNMYQWPAATKDARGWNTKNERPCLTINKTRQHNLQIINDARQNKTSVKVRPVGGGASYEAAQVYEGIVRRIEYISDAQAAYGTATRHQVQGGIGYWRVITDYAGPDTFEQDIFIKRIKDPLSVYVDPDFKEADGSDMRFGFIFHDVPRDEFDAEYPDYKDACAVALDNEDGWIAPEHVRIAEYFRRVQKQDRLVFLTTPEGREVTLKASEVSGPMKAVMEDALEEGTAREREIITNKVEWYLIIGDAVAEERDWAGQYVPIVRVPGEETVIDGELDRKGHTRALKDAQRMYNYNASAQVEFGALQNKIPYIAPAAAIEGYETYWDSANVTNYSVLPYNHVTDEGQEIIPAPQRATPPIASPAFQIGLQNAAQDMMMASGQYQAEMGAPSNERSGVAIQQRQRQGDTATYHFIDHLAMAIRFTGQLILDLIPHIYDTRRIIKIMAEDGTDSEVTVDPQAELAHEQIEKGIGETAERIVINPNVGRYEVMSDVGPAWATRRQEAFNAFAQIAAQNQELMLIIGDLMFKNADFPGADEIAERLKRLVPPQALGEGMPPDMQALMEQNEGLKQMVVSITQEMERAKLESANKESEALIKARNSDTEAYRAETDRMAALKEALFVDPGVQLLVKQLIAEALTSGLGGDMAGSAPVVTEPAESPLAPPLGPEMAGVA